MSLLGFLKFALNFLDLLAWPLFALGYPLCASIRAIENNSNSETQKLVTYWISFSLVSLFEHSFVNLLQWIQFWPYIKLMIICWLLIPYFDGASYVYNDFVRPCLLLNPQVIVDEFNKWRVLLWKRDHFLAEAERYIKGNGPEALEKLIDKEFKTKMPNVDVDDIKAIAATEKKEVEWSPNNKLEIVQKDNKVVEVIEKKEVSVVKRMVIAEPSLDQTDNRTLAINEIKGPDVVVAAARELPEIPTESEKTLNICQVTIESEKNKASYEASEANWPNIVNFGSFLTVLDSSEKITYQPIEKPQEIESTNGLKWQGQPNRYYRPQKQVPKKSVSNIGLKQKIFLTDEKKTQGWQKNVKKEAIGVNKNTFNYCNICNIRCSGKGNLVSHFQGKKHLAKVQVIYGCGDVGDSSKSGNNICAHDQDMDWDAPPVVCGNGWDWEPASPVVSGHGWD